MKKTVNEAYPKRSFTPKNNGGKSKRYIKVYVKRLTSASDAAQPNDSAADPSAPAVKPKEVIQVTLKNIGSDDAQQIKDTLIPNAKVFMSDAKSKTGASFKVPTMTFTIPDAKFAKWIKSMLPKIETILSTSNSSEYPSLDTLQNDILEAAHSAPSEETTQRAEQSLKEMEEAVYKAIRENRWDDAMVIYKKAINLMARVYGHQLSPNNVKSIYAQAEKAGIKPTDKGAATDSYWEDGTEKFWPTFVRSAQSWRKDFGRTIKDEPKMQYAMASGWRKNASDAQINDRLKSQGHNSLSDVSLQQRDKIKNGGLVGGLYGVGYDISDTEGPNDFFNAPGLLNNLDGTLTDSALADNDMWMKKLQDLKANDPQAQISDKDKKRELASTEDGKATIYLEAIEKLCSASRYDGGWGDLNITINNSDDKILAYLLTVEDIAKKKIETSGWKNKTNVDRIAQMVTAAVALCTVGKSKIPSLGYDFRDVSNVFSSFEECKSTVLSVSDYILSGLHRATSEDDKQNAMAAINENRLHRFFNLMERMNNRYNENYKYELSEGIINRPSDDVIMSFLGELGLNIEDDSIETNELM